MTFRAGPIEIAQAKAFAEGRLDGDPTAAWPPGKEREYARSQAIKSLELQEVSRVALADASRRRSKNDDGEYGDLAGVAEPIRDTPKTWDEVIARVVTVHGRSA